MSVYFMKDIDDNIVEYDDITDILNDEVNEEYVIDLLNEIYPPINIPALGLKNVGDIVEAFGVDSYVIDDEIDYLEDEISSVLENDELYDGFVGYISYNKEVLERLKSEQ